MNASDEVLLYERDVEIPTYPTGKPDKNPMFLDKRVYQGSSGKVYPLPIIDKISDEKVNRKWKVVFLENKYLQVWIMPQLGGRIQRALDKTNGYDFVYYNRVIKPALVGLAGPWISGGIEFNWPQHHRPTTCSPVEYCLKENGDGSKTVFVGEIDAMYGTKCTVGFTLYPGKAYIEIKAQLYNRTPQPQTFLWWANPAYSVNDNTQSVFPPDVHAVFDHGKRDVSRFPIATGTYYKVDYSAGVDISKYKNIPVPTSYMAYHSDFNFVGGYDNGRKAGLLHVADRHISPGKKQWTWGSGDFGKAWDRNLTDEDGPYVELMTGVYTDNQPDFSWLSPYEEKSFTQYFMPYKEIGAVKNASRDVALNLEVHEGRIEASAYASSVLEGVTVSLTGKSGVYAEQKTDLSPVNPYRGVFDRKDGDRETDLTLCVKAPSGEVLLSYTPLEKKHEKVPDSAKAMPVPAELPNNEALFLAGTHLEQYRHATCEPDAYYLEGLRRDPGDIRINNAYGLLLLRRGRFQAAEQHFRRAVKTLTRHNPNPYDSEPYYNLGLSLKCQGRPGEAYDAFFKACWSVAMQDCGYYSIAALDCAKGDFEAALAHVEKSILRNGHNYKARDLKAAVYRKLGRLREAEQFAKETASMDVMDFGAYNELYLAVLARDTGLAGGVLKRLETLMGGREKNHLELSLQYAEAGLYEEAAEILRRFAADQGGKAGPMVYYYLGWFSEKLGDPEQRDRFYRSGAAASPLYCFPNRLTDVIVLQSVQKANPEDAKAFYYLGNFWYDRRQSELAVSCFERSSKLDPDFPTVYRNLSLAYYNKLRQPERALKAMEKAFALDPSDARVFFELDQLYKKLGAAPSRRLAGLEKHMELVESRDDLYAEYITLLNTAGRFEKAEELMSARKFHPWEGGEGKITRQYVYAKVEAGKRLIARKEYEKALGKFLEALTYPENLGEGKLYGTQENHVHYYMGLAYERLGMREKNVEFYEKASVGLGEPAGVMFYNDQPPETIFYQGLAQIKLGRPEKARARFNKLIDYGEKHLSDQIRIDYFAVSLPDFLIFDEDLDKRNAIHCRYLIGLGYLGFGRKKEAAAEFEKALVMDPGHQGLLMHRKLVDSPDLLTTL